MRREIAERSRDRVFVSDVYYLRVDRRGMLEKEEMGRRSQTSRQTNRMKKFDITIPHHV
jgi:hypothetical protein